MTKEIGYRSGATTRHWLAAYLTLQYHWHRRGATLYKLYFFIISSTLRSKTLNFRYKYLFEMLAFQSGAQMDYFSEIRGVEIMWHCPLNTYKAFGSKVFIPVPVLTYITKEITKLEVKISLRAIIDIEEHLTPRCQWHRRDLWTSKYICEIKTIFENKHRNKGSGWLRNMEVNKGKKSWDIVP